MLMQNAITTRFASWKDLDIDFTIYSEYVAECSNYETIYISFNKIKINTNLMAVSISYNTGREQNVYLMEIK